MRFGKRMFLLRFGETMLKHEAREPGSVAGAGLSRMWPYHVGVASIVIAAVTFIFAPFSAIVYVALPGVCLATYLAFSEHRPFRVGLAVSSGVFGIGLLVGAAGLAMAGSMSGQLGTQGWGSAVVVAWLWALPLIGLVIGAVSLAGVYRASDTSSSASSVEEAAR